jgi:TolB-like protein/CheY-like chemotaxis protein/DNA-binding SARP family transcriptional activator
MLTIQLLGEMAVLRGPEPLALPPSKKTRALLAYLVATGRAQRRERLCTMFWDVPDDPRGALRWSLSKLRVLVDEPQGPVRLVADRETVAFVPEGAACDLLALRRLATARFDAVSTEVLEATANGIGGEFLEGFELSSQPDFQAWCLAEREDVRRSHAALLATLVARLSPDAPDAALPHARRLVALDGFDVQARAALVRLLARLGRRDEAKQHGETGLRMAREAGLLPGGLAEAVRELATNPLPRTNPAERLDIPSPAPETQARSDATNLVVVDDEPELGRMIAEYLGGHGFAVRVATSGQALDDLLAEMPADLVILDVNMPDEDGFSIARRLRNRSSSPRILFLSAAANVADRVTGLELGADDYLTKPFDLRELRARVQASLRSSMQWPSALPGPASRDDAKPVAATNVARDHAVNADGGPSIAVLPFRSLSDEGGRDLLADGMVEDLITALSHLRWFFVIARNSSFTYKDRMVPAPQVGRELGVRYVVEGAVRRAGDRVRITVQLVETESGTPVWADRFDGSIEDIFSLQDQVVARILTALEPNLRRAELARLRRRPPTAVPRAYEAYLRATACMHPMTKENCAAAIALLDQALRDDAGFGLALAASAWCRMWRLAQHQMDEIASEEEARMIALAEAALAASPDNPTVLAQVALVFCYLAHRRHAAPSLAEQAVALHPNSALAHAVAGWVQLYVGHGDAAIPHFATALKLDPLDPAAGEPMAGAAFAEILAGRVEQAIEWGERAVAASPNSLTSHRALVSALGIAGREAGTAVARMLALAPGFSLERYGKIRRRHADHPLTKLVDIGLRKAGVPEHN